MRSLVVTLALAFAVLTTGCGTNSARPATVSVVNVTDTVAFQRDVVALGGRVVWVDTRASAGRAEFPADLLARARRELTASGYRLVEPAPLPSVPDDPSAPA